MELLRFTFYFWKYMDRRCADSFKVELNLSRFTLFGMLAFPCHPHPLNPVFSRELCGSFSLLGSRRRGWIGGGGLNPLYLVAMQLAVGTQKKRKCFIKCELTNRGGLCKSYKCELVTYVRPIFILFIF